MMIGIYIAIGILVLIGIGNLMTYTFQYYFIFRPSRLPKSHQFNFENGHEIWVKSSFDGRINGLWFHKGQRNKRVVLYNHGNSSDLSKWGHLGKYYLENGVDLLIYDFRGFGKSTGGCNEEAFYDDARAMYNYLLSFYDPEEIVIYGRSMGTGPASQLAATVTCNKLMLETPYHSIRELFKSYYPFLPHRLFVFKYKFKVFEYVHQAPVPVHVLHGDNDWIIPLRCAKKLIPHIGEGSTFTVIKGGKHNNLPDLPEYPHYFTYVTN